ncbi:sigma E protease regulator RseP [unidentified bacterial endosymbiont]|uniref:sigma E protease regulator RseP n=1 Tax=unidentified bacterial endosymbiont TaxID=2355 RepID=UPI00209DFD16|nr:sigma E protease regulator RseP [unidentified bacterial endosymbiont]
MNALIGNLLAFLGTLGLLVAIHETGHFLAARLCGVKVERFALGFGPALWRRVDRRGTEFVIAAIPLGGYVKMLDERVQPVAAACRDQAFNHRPIWQRSVIITAGPLANFLLAFLAYWWIFLWGRPVLPPVIGTVLPQSVASFAGMLPGMQITAVGGLETPDWETVHFRLAAQRHQAQITVTVQPMQGGPLEQQQLVLQLGQVDWQPQSSVESLGIIPEQPQVLPIITRIEPQSAAEQATLQVGDRIVRVAGQPLLQWQQLVTQIRAHPQQSLSLEIERADQLLAITLTPQAQRLSNGQTVGYAGLAPKLLSIAADAWKQQRYGGLAAFVQAGKKTWQMSRLTLSLTGQLLTGSVGLKQLSGPIAIAKGAGTAVASGLVCFLGFIALISINLGIVNLLPLPVLDGGHMVFLLLEALHGRPVSERFQEISYRVGVLLLMVLTGVALFNDVMRS